MILSQTFSKLNEHLFLLMLVCIRKISCLLLYFLIQHHQEEWVMSRNWSRKNALRCIWKMSISQNKEANQSYIWPTFSQHQVKNTAHRRNIQKGNPLVFFVCKGWTPSQLPCRLCLWFKTNVVFLHICIPPCVGMI